MVAEASRGGSSQQMNHGFFNISITTSCSCNPLQFQAKNLSIFLTTTIYFYQAILHREKNVYFYNPCHKNPWKRNKATSGEGLPSEATPIENSREIVSYTASDTSSATISVLFFVAFLALLILAIGVIYIAVTDFLLKRERVKFEKEEASKKEKGQKGEVGGLSWAKRIWAKDR